MTTDVDPDLYSMALALYAVGVQLWPVPALLAAGAALVWAAPRARPALHRWRSSAGAAHV